MVKPRQGPSKPAQEPEVSPPKRDARKQMKVATIKATHHQGGLSPIKARRRPKSKPSEHKNETPVKPSRSRYDTKLHRAKYPKLKFHVDQAISTYPSTIYKSFDKDPQPARLPWVSPSFGPDISLQHVRDSIIKPDLLPSSMLTPIDRPTSKENLAKSGEPKETTFRPLSLTPSTSPFPSFRRKPLTTRQPSAPRFLQSDAPHRNETQLKSGQLGDSLMSPPGHIEETREKSRSRQPRQSIPSDRSLQGKHKRMPVESKHDRPVVLNDIFGPEVSSPTSIDPESMPDHSTAFANDTAGQGQLPTVPQGISNLMSTLLHHRKEIQMQAKETKRPRTQKVERTKRREEQAARVAQSLKKAGRVGKEIFVGKDRGSTKDIAESSTKTLASISEEEDVFGPRINAVTRNESDDRVDQQRYLTILSQTPPTTLHACATANHLKEAYPLDGTPITNSPLPALSSAVPLLLPAPAAQMRSQPRMARKRRILQADESQETVGLPTAQLRKYTPLARMNSLSINAPCPGFMSSTFLPTPSPLRESMLGINDPIDTSPIKNSTADVMLRRTPGPNTLLRRTRTLGIDLRRNVGMTLTPFKVPTPI